MTSHDLPRGQSFGTPANNRAFAQVSHSAGEQTKYTLPILQGFTVTKGWQS